MTRLATDTLRGVVFDLDGVIIDSRPAMERTFAEAYAEIVDPTGRAPFAEFEQHLGRPLPDILESLGLPAEMYDAFAAAATRNLHLLRVCPGIIDVLTELQRRGVLLAIATGKSKVRAVEALRAVGLDTWFAAICGSDEVAAGKPAPDLARLALDRLELEPAQCVFVGDALADLECAVAAGVRFAAAEWVGRVPAWPAERWRRPDWRCESPADLMRAIDTLERV